MRVVKLLIIFWLYCISRSILSEDLLLSLESSLFYGRFIFFALAIKYYLIKYTEISKYFGVIIWGTVLFVTFDALYQFLFGYNILNYKSDEYRISGIFGDEYVLGAFLSRLLPFCFYFIAIQKNIRGPIFLFAMLKEGAFLSFFESIGFFIPQFIFRSLSFHRIDFSLLACL